MSFGDLRKVKAARVEKECIWCWYPCAIGEPRVGFFGEWDGEPQDWHMHPECYDAFQREDIEGEGRIHDERHKRGQTCDEARDKELQKTSVPGEQKQ